MATPRHVFPAEICGGDPQPHVTYPHDRQMQELVSAGIKRNRNKIFKIELRGEFYYDLMGQLDRRGLDTLSIIEMRQCVHLTDRIMEQLRAQGFYGPVEAESE
jgi:hypothetical protein